MEDIETIVKTTVGEIEKMLNTKTVVGEPMVVDGTTLIPLISVGFAFGTGAGSGKMSQKQPQEGSGGGTGGCAGIKPVAIIVIDKNGVRIESIRGGLSQALEKIAESAMSMMMKKRESESAPKDPE
jgi:uncharacterized spore protein YtfJ